MIANSDRDQASTAISDSPQTNTDGDAQGNACDDYDNTDGPSSLDEYLLGTGISNSDSDSDDVNHGDDLAASGKPLANEPVIVQITTRYCWTTDYSEIGQPFADCPIRFCLAGRSARSALLRPLNMLPRIHLDSAARKRGVEATHSRSGKVEIQRRG